MKKLHRPDLYGYSQFNEERNIDFHSVLWVRPAGNILIDPLPLSAHDVAHLDALGGVKTIVITTSDHVRDAHDIAAHYHAEIHGPDGERETFPVFCQRWLEDNDEVVPGLRVFAMRGSKTPGELALLLEENTLITGDLIRAHEGGRLCLLPDAKLKDRNAAVASIKRLAGLAHIQAVLVGDGWPVFRDGGKVLRELADSLS